MVGIPLLEYRILLSIFGLVFTQMGTPVTGKRKDQIYDRWSCQAVYFRTNSLLLDMMYVLSQPFGHIMKWDFCLYNHVKDCLMDTTFLTRCLIINKTVCFPQLLLTKVRVRALSPCSLCGRASANSRESGHSCSDDGDSCYAQRLSC